MPIRRYVEHGVIFTPETLSKMSEAFTAAVETLEIGADEIKRQAVAQFIIRLAREDSEFDAAALRDGAVAAFRDGAAAIYQEAASSRPSALEARGALD